MSDRVQIPCADGWLVLPRDVYDRHLQRPASATKAPAATTELVDVKALAKALNLPTSSIYEQAKSGRFPCVRIGRHLRFDLAAVLATVSQSVKGS